MQIESAKVTVTANVKIAKYAEGESPETGAEPIEVVNQQIELTGPQAVQLLKEMGGDTNGIN